MGYENNPYQAYTTGSLFSGNPVNLVIALYQGALDATQQAERYLQERDIPARTKAINKAVSILSELICSLDYERGGEIAQNLKRLYGYMQKQILTAHMRQQAEPLAEVTKLLNILLEGWRGAAKKETAAAELPTAVSIASAKASVAPWAESTDSFYGGYMDDSAGARSNTAYSF